MWSAVGALVKGAQDLNAEGMAALEEAEGEEVVDARDAPEAERAKGGIEFNCDFNLKIGGLDIACKLGRGQDGSWTIGLVAQKEGNSMKGSIEEVPDQDVQGSFTDDAWKAVQSDRGLITQKALGQEASNSSAQKNDLRDLEYKA